MFDLPEAHSAKRSIREDPSLGYEFYKTDATLWEWTMAAAAQLGRNGDGAKPLLVDFGGASGFKAMHLARQGFDAVVIDLVIDEKIFDARNRVLSMDAPAAGTLKAVETDVRRLSDRELTAACGRRSPSLMTGFNFIHFLKSAELETFFDLLHAVTLPGARIGLSYANARSLKAATRDRPYMTFHDEADVARLAQERGFRLTHCENRRDGCHTGHAFVAAGL